MKTALFALLSLILLSCAPNRDQRRTLQARIDTLEKKLAGTYRPGFGEFMSSVQAHHAKLWFAGQNQNWPLADFEIHEIKEVLEDLKTFQTERKESQLLNMIEPAIDSVALSIEQKKPVMFINSYIVLTQVCNNCHRSTHFEFNVVKIPEASVFSNQDFRPAK
jgi:hypothetical protein